LPCCGRALRYLRLTLCGEKKWNWKCSIPMSGCARERHGTVRLFRVRFLTAICAKLQGELLPTFRRCFSFCAWPSAALGRSRARSLPSRLQKHRGCPGGEDGGERAFVCPPPVLLHMVAPAEEGAGRKGEISWCNGASVCPKLETLEHFFPPLLCLWLSVCHFAGRTWVLFLVIKVNLKEKR